MTVKGTNNDAPVLWVIAGPNGAGKTTFAKEFLPKVGITEFLNADFIAAGLSPLHPEMGAFQAGRLLLRRWDKLVDQRISFAVESTLSGKTYFGKLERARAAGYRIHMTYLWLPSVRISLKRIRQRVKMGGHFVPEKDVRRRFPVSLVNFHDSYRDLAVRSFVWDISTSPPQKIIEWSHTSGKSIIYETNRYEAFKNQIKRYRQTQKA